MLQKVTRGAALRIPASDYNSFIDAAKYVRNQRTASRQGNAVHEATPGTIYVRNDSGEEQRQFAVLGLDGIVISPNDNEREFRTRVVLSCVTPDSDTHRGRFCVLAEPIKAGRIGRAFVDSVTQVRLNVPSGSSEPLAADITDGSSAYLTAAVYGSATILWREGGTGEQWAVVRFGRLPSQFPVNLTRVGGSQGTASSPATWLYNVIDPVTNATIASSVNPVSSPHKWQRPSVGWMTEATAGLAHFDCSGAIVLGWINETVDQEACEEEA